MDAHQVGKRLVELCSQGKDEQVMEELYADDIVSVEAGGGPDAPEQGEREFRGKEAVQGKWDWWNENHEVHGTSVRGPFPHGDDRFATIFTMDVTHRASGHRFTMEEVAVYTVDGGRIIREEFFYGMD